MTSSLNQTKERTNSLRVKIVLSLIGMSILATALSGFYTRLVLMERFRTVITARASDEFSRDVASYYRNNGGSFEEATKTISWQDYSARLNATRPEKSIKDVSDTSTFFIGTDLDGKVWIPNDGFSIGDIVSQTDLNNAIPIVNIASPEQPTIGYVLVEGRLDLSGAEAQYLIDLKSALWVVFFIVALMAVPLGMFLGKRFTDPINKLNNAIKAMRPESMQQSVQVTSNDEIGSLSKSFNQMNQDLSKYVNVVEEQQSKISESEAMRREGLVSISHELRTPLHRSVTQAYAILDGVRPLDRNEVSKLAASLDHLAELVNDLHQLSLSDVNAFSCDIQKVDYTAILCKELDIRKEVFVKNSLTLKKSLPEEFIVCADPTRLRQIIENLLSNCVRYTKRGGEVDVRLSSIDDKFAELIIADNGPGVPPENLEFLFDRFYREENSRNRETGGSGLGLSLVKTCAEMHGGHVEAFQSEQGGLKIRVCIPIDSAHL